jgi:transposase
MFSLTSGHRFMFYPRAVDMRKGFDALSGLVLQEMKRNVLSGEVFVFVNSRRNCIKLLHWEPGGLVLYYKRLECGTLEFPDKKPVQNVLEISWTELVLLVEGVALKSVKKRKRYSYSD